MKLLTRFFGQRCAVACGLLVGIAPFAGCRTPPPLPPADWSVTGWQVRQGQAVWQPPRKRPELTGEILVALRTNGDAFVQFTKDPFPLATAQTAGERWQIDFTTGRKSWRGRGQPPDLFLWFQLPVALRGNQPRPPWEFRRTNDTWRLENPRTGEWLEGRFFQ